MSVRHAGDASASRGYDAMRDRRGAVGEHLRGAVEAARRSTSSTTRARCRSIISPYDEPLSSAAKATLVAIA